MYESTALPSKDVALEGIDRKGTWYQAQQRYHPTLLLHHVHKQFVTDDVLLFLPVVSPSHYINHGDSGLGMSL